VRAPRLLVGAILLAGAGIAYAWYPPFRLFTWVAVGRSPDCPLLEALASERNGRIEKECAARIYKESKLISVDAEGFELWQTPRTRYWIPRGRRYALSFSLAGQERQIFGTGDAGPRAGDIVIDCGAQAGVTVAAALDAGAEKVVAIEPAPENIECLTRNFSSEIATGRVMLYPMISIDKLVAELGLTRVDYIKFDMEGAEPSALRGANDTIARFKPRISVATYRKSDPKLISQIISGMRPAYQERCGPCAVVKDARSIRPDVLYFK